VADEPDATTGTARAARGEQGRPRHGHAGDAAARPAPDASPRRSRRSRHARPAADAGAPPPVTPYPGSHADAGRDAYSDWYRSDPYDPVPADPPPAAGDGAAGYTAGPQDSDPYGGAPYAGTPDDSDPYGSDPYGSDPHSNDPRSNDPYGSAPYRNAPHAAPPDADPGPLWADRLRGGATDAGLSNAQSYAPDSYAPDSYNPDPYRSDPYRGNTYGSDVHGADLFGGDDLYGDTSGRASYDADPYDADPYRADPYDAAPHRQDPHRGGPHRQESYRGGPDGADPSAVAPRTPRSADHPYGTDRARAEPPRAGPRRRVAPDGVPDRQRPEPQRAHREDDRDGARPGSHGTEEPRGDARPFDPAFPHPAPGPTGVSDPDQQPDAPPDPGLPAAPGMPDRRPGDPPGVPAELFVETTAETPALRLDDLPPELDERTATSDAAEEAPHRAPPAGRGRSLLMRLRPGRDDAPATGHGHGHGPARPAGRRVRIVIAALLVPCALATLVGLALLWPTGGPPPTAGPITQEQVRAEVTATRVTDCTQGSGDGGCVALVVHMADGPLPGRDLVQVVPVEPGSPQFTIGDQVVLGWSGADPEDAGSYQIVDFQRGAPLAWLAGLFAVAVLLLGRWRGLAALAALALSFVVLLVFVVPAILAGRDPLAVAVVGSCLIMFAVLYLTHGPSARTSTAVLGTLLSLALIGGLGAAFSAAAQLTGLDDQTSNLIASLGAGVDARGLLLAGVVIGALGVLDDVTVTQTSAVWELRHANPQLGARALFTAAMRIGRDHVASAVNTLVLAYAGAALPLMLLFSLSGRGLGEVVTAQDVATEVVRTLVGSIGLVASVPITTAIAAAVAVRETAPTAEASA
jgi:uncharacterized membrane protein